MGNYGKAIHVRLPIELVERFETLHKEQGKLPRAFAYISTHPETELRIARLKSLIAGRTAASKKLLPDYSWDDIKKLCPAPAEVAKE